MLNYTSFSSQAVCNPVASKVVGAAVVLSELTTRAACAVQFSPGGSTFTVLNNILQVYRLYSL